MLEVKLRHTRAGEHVRTHVFARWPEHGDTFALLGTLVTDVGQYQLIFAALAMGAEQTHGNLTVLPSEGWSPEKEAPPRETI